MYLYLSPFSHFHREQQPISTMLNKSPEQIRLILLILLLPVLIPAMAVQPDTVAVVEYPAALSQNEQGEWDFSTLPPAGATPVVSTMETAPEKLTITEGDSRFYFDIRTDGNYFTGWEDSEKTVVMQQGYNQKPHLLIPGSSYTVPYEATGKYTGSGINTAITGAYSTEVLGTGALLLPDGRRFCAATLVKTVDRYHETSCNTTEVRVNKHLWYVPYYPLPVFVSVETAYAYTGGGSDTLRSAYYTVNAMPKPEIRRSNNDTIICVGNEVKLQASGFGLFSLRNHTLNTAFEDITDTLVVRPQQTTTYVFKAADEQCYQPAVFDTVTVTVETPPVLRLLNCDTTICETAPMELRATSDYQLQWYELDDNGQALALAETHVTPLATTRYMAKAYNTACVPVSAGFKVNVNPVPEPLFSIVQTDHEVLFLLTDPMVKGYSYNYDFGDLYRAYNLSPYVHTYQKPGSYTATLTVIDYRTGCERSNRQSIVIAEPETAPEPKFLLYPNPVEDIATVIAPEAIVYYSIVEAGSGRLFMEKTLPGTEMSVQIDMQSLHVGAYIIQVRTIDQRFNKLFIKAK